MIAGARRANREVRGLTDLRMVARQVYFEQLNFWKNPVGASFTVLFSVIFLVLVGSGANQASSALHGVRLIQYYVPGFLAYGVTSACFNVLALTLVVRRETGLFKRLRLSPLPAWAMLGAITVNAAIITAIEVVLVLMIGRFGYHVVLPHNVAALVIALVVGTASFTAIGAATSTLVPNQEAGGPVVSIVYFVLLFLSGLWFPLKQSSGLARFSSIFPLRRLIVAVYAPFDTRPGVSGWDWGDLGVIALWGAVAVIVALRRWSWSPRAARPRAGSRRRSRRTVPD